MPVLTEERKNANVPPPPVWPGDGGDGDSWQSRPAFPISKGQLCLWLFLTGLVMLFAGFSSAYIILRGVPAWQNVAMPGVLWLNTAILLASSATIELSRRAIRKGLFARMKRWLGVSGALGVAFLIGQLVAWRQLIDAGVYLPTTLHGSFFYVLTGIHGIHLLGGVGALIYVLSQAWRNRYTAAEHEPLKLCATYWHFLDALWVYLFLMFVLA